MDYTIYINMVGWGQTKTCMIHLISIVVGRRVSDIFLKLSQSVTSLFHYLGYKHFLQLLLFVEWCITENPRSRHKMSLYPAPKIFTIHVHNSNQLNSRGGISQKHPSHQ